MFLSPSVADKSTLATRLTTILPAMSLARLWLQQRRRQEAHDLLAPICGWVTGGFDTSDLQEARALLHEFS